MSTRTSSRKLRFTAAALFLGTALALSGCANTSAPEETGPLVDSGQEIDTVRVGLGTSLANLYVGQEDGINNYWVAANVQEGLVGFSPDGKVIPALATEWNMPDPTTYVFQLRQDALFHNGDPVTADDIVFSFEQAMNPELSPGTSYYLSNFESIEKTGDHEITVKLGKPDGAALTILSNAGAMLVTQQKFWEEHEGNVGTTESLLMGSGPYKVTEFRPDSHVTLERVDTWWGGVPKAKEIQIDFIIDENTRLLATQKGDLDMALSVPLKQLPEWEKLDTGRIVSTSDLSYVGLTFDQNVAPFDDKNVREAIALSVDQQAIVEKLLRGNGEVANTIMTPESLAAAFDGDEAREFLSAVPARAFDIDQAKKLMAQSSVPEGFAAEITYPNSGPQLGTAAQSIAENVKQLGITLNVREISTEEWLATIGDGEHGLGFMWYYSTTGDPGEINGYLMGLEENPNNINSDAAQQLIDQASAATDPVNRAEVLLELEKMNEENVYNAPLWWGKSIVYFSNTIGINEFSSFSLLSPWGAQLFAAK